MNISLTLILFFVLKISFAQNQTTSTSRIDTTSHHRDSVSYGNSDGIKKQQILGIGFFGADSTSAYNIAPTTRKVVTPPTYNGTSTERGRIALDIWVDETGKVVKVQFKESQSINGSAHLISEATKAAYTMKYEAKPGSGIERVTYHVFVFHSH